MNEKETVSFPQGTTRRGFLSGASGALAAGGAAGAMGPLTAAAPAAAPPGGQQLPATNRVGAVAYCLQYAIGLFNYQKRPGERFDAVKFVDATRQAGGSVAQLYVSMIQPLDEEGLKRLRRRAAELDVMLEVHGGTAFAPQFERTLQQAAVLGAKVVGTSFGMLTRPNVIDTLPAWDEHLAKCKARLRQLVEKARPLGITVAVENHLDLTVEELRDMIREIDSPHAGVLFDVGNTVGTLDDPSEAADLLGPYTVATHYKDFAIEEVTRGFRFTMVPLGAGSLRLREITARLLKHVSPEMGMSIEMLNGQQFEVRWLEDRFWGAFRDKSARQVAATLRHVRSKAIDISQFKPQEEIDKLPHGEHVQFELDRMAACIAHLKRLLQQHGGQKT